MTRSLLCSGPGPVFADIDDSFQGLAPAAGLASLARACHQEERTFKVDSQLCAPLWHERKKFSFCFIHQIHGCLDFSHQEPLNLVAASFVYSINCKTSPKNVSKVFKCGLKNGQFCCFESERVKYLCFC